MKIFTMLLVIFTVLLCSCNMNTSNGTMDNPTQSITYILNSCKGHAIVISKGFNPANFKHCQHTMIIKDDSTDIFYEYAGTDYKVNVGDTLK